VLTLRSLDASNQNHFLKCRIAFQPLFDYKTLILIVFCKAKVLKAKYPEILILQNNELTKAARKEVSTG